MSRPEYQLTEKDLKEANFRSMLTHIGMFNYQTQNGPHVAYGLGHALRKLYPDDEDYKKALLNHYKYYNCQPYLSSFIEGAALGMEQELGIEGADAIQNFKTGLMGPGAGIGDSIFWIILPAIFTPICAALAYEGNYAGIIISVVSQAIIHVFRVQFFGWGFKLGMSVVDQLKDYIAPFTDAASILGLVVIGCLIPSTISVTIPLEWTLSTGSVINIQSLLDQLVPNLLSIIITAVCYKALSGRKVSMTTLVLVVLVVSVVLSALGVLA